MITLLISQVLNNNVLLVEDEQRQQKIIWGRGIGFKSRRGQQYTLQANDQVFSSVPPNDNKWVNSFKELADKIPREYFELSKQIIQLAQTQIDAEFDEHLLIPLTDHIYFAVQRFKMGLNLANPMLYNLKRFFAQEYQVGKQAQRLISHLAGIPISDDEAGFIAIHLVEHEIQHSDSDVRNFSNFLEISTEVNNIIETVFGRQFSDDSIAVSRLMTHLHYLILKSRSHQPHKPSATDATLFATMSQSYRRAASCLQRVVSYLEDKINYHFTDSDQLYLLIHIIHITE